MKHLHGICMVLLFVLLCALLPAFAAAETAVTLPDGYETSGQSYPVIYLMPEDGFASDESGLAAKLSAAMADGTGTPMIIVHVTLAEGDDPIAAVKAAIADTDAQYRTLPGREYRTLMGTGAGGYLAYAVGLELQEEVGVMASIRGDFTGNPWYSVLGDVQDKIEAVNGANPDYLNGVYTYMDAPVEDAYTDQPGGTNEMGALFIGYGTGSAAHEFTVRPGAYDDAFLTESVARVMNRLTVRMLSGAAVGSVSLERTTLTADDAQAVVNYSVTMTDLFAVFAPGGAPVEIVVSVVDPATGEVLASASQPAEAAGSAMTGAIAIDNKVNGTSSTVKLSVRLLGTELELATATLIRTQPPVIDGDMQKIELMGDWYFNYAGMTRLDVAALTKEEITSWSVVQPALTSWTKGFGNIDDTTVVSMYGPDYFDFFITGSGYYAKTFEVPADFDSQDVLLSIGYVDDRCEVYLNGVRVGATGMDEAGEPTGETTWAQYSCFAIDPALLVRGGENTVVVRAWNDLPYGAGGWYGGPVGLYSRAAFDAMNGSAASDRFYEESFASSHAAAALGQGGTVDVNYLIYLPEGYETSGRYYPTVYLLHQFNSDHTSYRGDKVNVLFDQGVAEGLFDEMIVVIPNSSEESWWAGEWEKMITDELIPHIDGEYRTIRDARFRLTAGCSMGGQGAMGVALRNPDYFTGAVSFFGAFSYGGANSPNAIAMNESAAYMDSYSLYFICGNQDSYGFGVPAISLHQQLKNMDVNHGFFIDNGGHDSAFYIPFFKDAFAYIRSDMYKSDDAVEGLLQGKLRVDGTVVTAEFVALPGIEAYLYTPEASSYTKNASQPLSVPLTIEVLQDGEVVCDYVVADHAVIGEGAGLISFDMAGGYDPAKPVEILFHASIFDRTVLLDEIK